MKKLLFLFLVFLGICITTEMFAQWKPLADMTDAEIEKRVIDEWDNLLTLLMYGVKMNDRVVEFFAQNFGAGALKWLHKEDWKPVDYVTAYRLTKIRSWYCGSWYDTVWLVDKYQPQIHLYTAIDRIMYATEQVYIIKQGGGMKTSPPEYYNLKSMFDY